jgi:hypothetical protein
MEKLVYVLWRRPETDERRFREALLGETAARCRDAGARDLAASLVDEDVAPALRARITRLDPPPAGIFSFWLETHDERGPCEEALRAATERVAGYLTVESVPLRPPAVSLGKRAPGVNMVALLQRPERHSREAWLRQWLEHHRAVALETQWTFAYVRNVVVRALTPDAPPWEGIVEEGFPAEAVTNPMLWYKAGGDPEVLKRNIGRMLDSCRAFLDLERVESHPTSRYRL